MEQLAAAAQRQTGAQGEHHVQPRNIGAIGEVDIGNAIEVAVHRHLRKNGVETTRGVARG